MAPVASTAALQLQERVFQLEVKQKGNLVSTNQNLTDSVSLCFAPLVLPLSVVPPLMGSLFFLSLLHVESFPLSSFLPRGIAMHRPGVDRGTEKPVDDSLHGNVEEYASVYERE